MYNHYFDHSRAYTHSMPAGSGDCPLDASRDELPLKPWPNGVNPIHIKGVGWSIEATQEQVMAISYKEYEAALDSKLDDLVLSRGYKSVESLATYATSTNEQFKSEALFFIQLRDSLWTQCFIVFAKVMQGEISPPTFDELFTMLPAIKWPEELNRP